MGSMHICTVTIIDVVMGTIVCWTGMGAGYVWVKFTCWLGRQGEVDMMTDKADGSVPCQILPAPFKLFSQHDHTLWITLWDTGEWRGV